MLTPETDFIELTSGESFSPPVMEKLENAEEVYGPYQSCHVTISVSDAISTSGVGTFTWQTYQRNSNIAIVGTRIGPDQVYDEESSSLLWNRDWSGVLQTDDGYATFDFVPENSARVPVTSESTWHLTITNTGEDEADVGLIYANAIQLLSIAGAIAAILAF